jgi:hypothetical protein
LSRAAIVGGVRNAEVTSSSLVSSTTLRSFPSSHLILSGMNKDDKPDRVGLCASCQHAEVIRSSKGSTFYLCKLSAVDPGFPRYPPLPVVSCSGYQPCP